MIKVHLMGGDESGWALDQDLATTRAALEELDDLVQLVSMKEADVVHSVWEEPLLNVPPHMLSGKRIVCHECNDILRSFEKAYMCRSIDTIGLRVAISTLAMAVLEQMRLKCVYIPYAVDTSIFHKIPAAELDELRLDLAIPNDSYVISSFMRDTLGSDLTKTKPQKCAEMFLEIVTRLHESHPIHVLLAGPRRHWLRDRLRAAGIPLTFVGEEIEVDDYTTNILSPDKISRLYQLSDLHLVTSRWEGGPRAVLEAAATGTAIVTTRVGMGPDVLEPQCIFDSVDEAIRTIEDDIASGALRGTVKSQLERVVNNFTPSANVGRFRQLYEDIEDVEPFVHQPQKTALLKLDKRSFPVRAIRLLRRSIDSIALNRNGPGADMCIGLWHKYRKPPWGGANQFMIGLKGALEALGVKVIVNRISSAVDVYVCNGVWFDVDKFARLASRSSLKMIHRLDGPIDEYRGSGSGMDDQVYDLNSRFASATVYQSGWCFSKMRELGREATNPVIIRNAPDAGIFNREGRIEFSRDRKVRIVSSAWSDNPRKGGPFIKSLEGLLDRERYEYTFIGRCKEEFSYIKHIPALPSAELADQLRQHDVYLMASECESCSNALLEAMACGLPVIYRDDGGNGELTQYAGLPFTSEPEALKNLDLLVDEYEAFQKLIHVDTMDDVARQYLALARRVKDM